MPVEYIIAEHCQGTKAVSRLISPDISNAGSRDFARHSRILAVLESQQTNMFKQSNEQSILLSPVSALQSDLFERDHSRVQIQRPDTYVLS